MRLVIVAVVFVLLAAASPVYFPHAVRLPTFDPYLLQILPTTPVSKPLLVVLTFWNVQDRSLLDGVAANYKFHKLSMASALLTPSQINGLSSWSQIRSIWYGLDKIPLDLAESRDIVKASQATASFGVTGRGVNVAVIDTGIDAPHPDLVNNVAAVHVYKNGF
jgi:subtilisin family serine protease